MTTRRTLITRCAAGAAACASIMALSTAGASGAFANSAPAVHSNGYTPTEQCLNWNGAIKTFPALTKTSQTVTDVISGTLSNCNDSGTPQTYSGTFFGTLTGTATKSAASLSGQIAISWPADSGFDPTIASISISGSGNAYTVSGTGTAGAFTGQQLQASDDVVSKQAISGGTSQSLVGTAPFEMTVNEG